MYLCDVKVNVHKYPNFEDYYEAVVTRLDGKRINRTREELEELIYIFYYKDIPDTQAIMLTQNIYSIYRKFI